MIKFLDKEGLSKLSQEIKKKLAEKANVSHNHTISEVTDLNIATTETDGLMSSTDKTKLDSLENYDDTELVTQVNTNTTNIATNTENIETNATNIATNEENISVNATNIATNAENISVNATNIANKVDKVEGKDLSSNDYTDEEKEKLAKIVDSLPEVLTSEDGYYLSTEDEQVLICKEFDCIYSIIFEAIEKIQQN